MFFVLSDKQDCESSSEAYAWLKSAALWLDAAEFFGLAASCSYISPTSQICTPQMGIVALG